MRGELEFKISSNYSKLCVQHISGLNSTENFRYIDIYTNTIYTYALNICKLKNNKK